MNKIFHDAMNDVVSGGGVSWSDVMRICEFPMTLFIFSWHLFRTSTNFHDAHDIFSWRLTISLRHLRDDFPIFMTIFPIFMTLVNTGKSSWRDVMKKCNVSWKRMWVSWIFFVASWQPFFCTSWSDVMKIFHSVLTTIFLYVMRKLFDVLVGCHDIQVLK